MFEGRNKGLDIIRGIAVILVLCRHCDWITFLYDFGWLGVDLFFVLSGFLISNLLFKEFKANNSLNLRRFFLKRSFKIFPAFYFFVAVCLLVNYFGNNSQFETQNLLVELFYMQSYLTGIWMHTWTLAVEEHFYILFPLLLWLIFRFKITKKSILFGLPGLLVLVFCLRYRISAPHMNETFGFTQSHLRCDGILFGILASYLVNFTNFYAFFSKYKFWFFILAIGLLIPSFFFMAGSFYMNTVGLTASNLAFAIVLLLCVELKSLKRFKGDKLLQLSLAFIAMVGINSYSIYLWHLFTKDYVLPWFSTDSAKIDTVIYIFISIFWGIILSNLIEKPSLRLRNYLIKSRKDNKKILS